MRDVDRLSDTTYRREAVKQLDRLLGDRNPPFPVKSAQIYGLRQIARQQPDKVQEFARKQRTRAEKKRETPSAKTQRETASAKTQPKLEAEIAFWTLVANLCSSSTAPWSVQKEARAYLPVDLRDEHIPARQSGMTQEERRLRNQLKEQQREWIACWEAEHIPAFFERFCTEALYRIGMAANSEEE